MVRDGGRGDENKHKGMKVEKEKCVHQPDLREKLGDCQADHL